MSDPEYGNAGVGWTVAETSAVVITPGPCFTEPTDLGQLDFEYDFKEYFTPGPPRVDPFWDSYIFYPWTLRVDPFWDSYIFFPKMSKRRNRLQLRGVAINGHGWA